MGFCRVRIAAMANQSSVIAANWTRIQDRIAPAAERGGRRADEITVVAVSKTHPVEAIVAADAEGKCLPVLIEVRLGDEETKSGVAEVDLLSLATSIAPFAHLEFAGLMTIPPFFDEPEGVRPYFRKLGQLRHALMRKLSRALPVLSMGMSHDFEVAIEEGATEIRVGTALFGSRGSAG